MVIEDDGVCQLFGPRDLVCKIGLLVGVEVADKRSLDASRVVLGEVAPAVLVEALRGDGGRHLRRGY